MEIKERVLALDVGDKRIGVAVSDPFFLFATGLKVIIRENDNKALEEIKEICQTYKIKKIVVGLPYNMDGSIGPQAQKTVQFIEKLSSSYEIIYKDESGIPPLDAKVAGTTPRQHEKGHYNNMK